MCPVDSLIRGRSDLNNSFRFFQGAFVGAIAGFAISGWASFGSNAAIGSGLIVPKKLLVPLCAGNSSNYGFLKQFEPRK